MAVRKQKLERIVVLVDVRDVVSHADAAGYASAIEDFVQKVLRTGSMRTLWAFKFFDSSLSSFASTSRVRDWLGKVATGSHYTAAGDNCKVFRECLHKLVAKDSTNVGEARADFIVRALKEVLTDFTWDSLDEASSDEDSMPQMDRQFWRVKPNLVLLLSSMPATSQQFSEFLSLAPSMRSMEKLAGIFISRFGVLHNYLQARKIHTCWIQPPDLDGAIPTSFQKEILNRMKWNFTRLDTFVVSSFLIPHSLIMPCITCPAVFSQEKKPRISAKLKVSLLDKDSSQIQLLICQVDMAPLNGTGCDSKNQMESSTEASFSPRRLSDCTKIRLTVAAILPRGFLRPFALQRTRPYLIFEHRSRGEDSTLTDSDGTGFLLKDELFRRLQHFPQEVVSETLGLQLLLVYMARIDGVGLVNVEFTDTCSQNRSLQGILDPFTIHSAILSIGEIGDISCLLRDSSIKQLETKATAKRKSFASSSLAAKKSKVSSIKNIPRACSEMESVKSNLLHASSWKEAWVLCLRLLQCCDSDTISLQRLEDCLNNDSKYMRFLKCWMKHIHGRLKSSLLLSDITKWLKVELRGVSKTQEGDKINEPMDDKPAQELNGVSKGPEDDIPGQEVPVVLDDTPDPNLISVDGSVSYVSSLNEKLSSCLDSAEIDVQSFARRIVRDTIAAVKVVLANASLELELQGSLDTTEQSVFEHLKKLLLANPKKLASKYRKNHYTSEQKVKEYVFQIKLRLEIIAADIIEMPKEQERKDLVEQICDLLSGIEFNLPGGIFEMESLLDFSDRTIHSRYNDIIPQVVDEIYTIMEFKGYGETSASQFQTIQSMIIAGDVDCKEVFPEENSVQPNSEGSYSHTNSSCEAMPQSHGNSGESVPEEKLREAKEKRERARRKAHFSGRTQKMKFIGKPSRPSKSRQKDPLPQATKPLMQNDVVAETPMPNRSLQLRLMRGDEDEDDIVLASPEEPCISPCHRRPVKKLMDKKEAVVSSPLRILDQNIQGLLKRRCKNMLATNFQAEVS